jgi:hypothetical protein
MLRRVKELYNYVLEAEDGQIGRCKDFLFDDRFWTIRYMVAETGKWLPKKKVLVSPISLGKPDWDARLFPVRLTKKQIEEAPDLDEAATVSREYEKKWLDHYGWSYYWFGGGLWGPAADPTGLYVKGEKEKIRQEGAKPVKSHLRSVQEVKGYRIRTVDGEIGHAEDFIVSDETWDIRHMVVDTRNWLPGGRVLVSPAWIDRVDWAESNISVYVNMETVKNSPK